VKKTDFTAYLGVVEKRGKFQTDEVKLEANEIVVIQAGF
jgi:hypothetical protein